MRQQDLRLVLASGSPRRSELLDMLGLNFEVRPADIDETPRHHEKPRAYVERLSEEKAVAQLASGECVIAADTIVVLDGEILGKPNDESDSARMLARLAGQTHEVFTGVATAMRRETELLIAQRVCRSKVTFRKMSAADLAWYVRTGEGLDKAGSYAVQGLGALFIAAIEGNYTNIMGLPLPDLRDCLLDFELDLLRWRRS